jgi:hypothetical protein
VALCGQRNISITIKEQEVKEGKPKGMLQILWERSWIDSSKVVTARSMRYSKHVKKEDFGEDGKLKEASQQYGLSRCVRGFYVLCIRHKKFVRKGVEY